jgi:hypothetical protein
MAATRMLSIATLGLLLSSCASLPPAALYAEVIAEGVLNCFAAAQKDAERSLIFCEASAAVIDGDKLIVASDKHMPAGTPILTVKPAALSPFTPDANSIQYLQVPLINGVRKLEGMAKSPDGRYIFATTAFDRIARDSAKLDGYNCFLFWPAGKPEQMRVANSSSRGGVTSSLALRQRIEAHLGVPYFKIEGLMALPGERLIFGLRETGNSYKDFRYRVLLIETRYRIDASEQMIIDGNFRTLLDFDPKTVLPDAEGLGLSSIEYEPQTRRIYLTTAHEKDDKLGAYLWSMELAELDAGTIVKPIPQPTPIPIPIPGPDGKPLHFDNKAEGIAILGPDHLFIVHDDDRILGGKHARQAHQAVFSVIKINSGQNIKP